MSNELPRIGDAVTVDDPMGYSGTGVVRDTQAVPHLAVLVELTTAVSTTWAPDASATRNVVRKTWVLAPHVKVVP